MELKKAINDDWGTPKEVFQQAELLFGEHDLDVAGEENWSMCKKFIDKTQNCLDPCTEWDGQNIWINPPYDIKSITKFVDRALKEVKNNGKSVTMLVPCKTDQKWFHKLVESNCDFYFIEGRIKFNRRNGAPAVGAGFACMFVRVEPSTDGFVVADISLAKSAGLK